MQNEIKKVSEIIEKANPDDVVILSHPDHDGITSTVLFNAYFKEFYGKKSKSVLYPSKENPYHFIFNRLIKTCPKILLVLDALIGRYRNFVIKLLKKGTIVINLDHHDIVDISSSNYYDLNPHKWQIEYLNSSSLAWQVLREINKKYFDERSWIAGIGSVQDLCYYDNLLLFETMHKKGLSKIEQYDDLFDSKLMKFAKMINASYNDTGYDYIYSKILNSCIFNSKKGILEDIKIQNSYNTYVKKSEKLYNVFKDNHQIYPKINLIAYKHYEKARTSLIAEISEKDRRPLIYFGYYDGLLGFCSLFCDYDVRELARLFNGGGPHPKIAGGRTKRSFHDVIDIISDYFHPKQRSLDDFF